MGLGLGLHCGKVPPLAGGLGGIPGTQWESRRERGWGLAFTPAEGTLPVRMRVWRMLEIILAKGRSS